MALVFHRELAIPLWPIAFCAIALAAPPRLMPSVTALVGVAVVASTMMAMVRWRRSVRPVVDVLPAQGGGTKHARILDEADDAVDLVRMDDDGGWQMARPIAPLDGGDQAPDQRLR